MGNTTEGRELMGPGSLTHINRVKGATDQEAMEAFATDLLRRVKAGELDDLEINARDALNGGELEYRL